MDPWDWNFSKYGTGQSMTNHIVANIEANVRIGSIVLSHDNQKPATTAAYRILLPWLTARCALIALPPEPLAQRGTPARSPAICSDTNPPDAPVRLAAPGRTSTMEDSARA